MEGLQMSKIVLKNTQDKEVSRLGVKYPIYCIQGNYFEQEKDGTLNKTNHQVLQRQYGKEVNDEVTYLIGHINEPSHVNYQQVVGDKYNSYKNLMHEPIKGEWNSIELLLKHIFGDQYEMSLEYLWNLYLNPKQKLPFLGLVSEAKGTGKSTFITFLHLMFKGNAVVVSAQDFKSQFNSSFAPALIATSDEHTEVGERKTIGQKLKMYITESRIRVEPKGQNPYTIGFYGKFVFASNEEDKLTFIEEDNTRYWIVKVDKLSEVILDFNNKLKEDIPAFLYYLKNEFVSTESRGRLFFSPSEFQNDASRNIQANSRSSKFNEISEALIGYFEANPNKEYVETNVRDLRVFLEDRKSEEGYIRQVLKKEFKMKTQDQKRFYGLTEMQYNGTPFMFKRSDFVFNETDEAVAKQLEISANANLVYGKNDSDNDIPF